MQQLHQDLLKAILQRMDQRQRSTCAVVSTAFARAAAAATGSIHLPSLAPPQHASLEVWLAARGEGLTSLHLAAAWRQGCGGRVLRRLPCPQLRELALSQLPLLLVAALPAGAGAGSSSGGHDQQQQQQEQPAAEQGLLVVATGLTSLALHHCVLVAAHGSDSSSGRSHSSSSPLAALSCLTQLQRLELGVLTLRAGVALDGSNSMGQQQQQQQQQQLEPVVVPPDLLCHLGDHLTHLRLSASLFPGGAAGLQQLRLGGLSRLHELRLTGCGRLGADALGAALRQLPWLASLAVEQGYGLHLGPGSGLEQLTGLTRLELLGCRSLVPGALAGLTRLVHLDLSRTAAAVARCRLGRAGTRAAAHEGPAAGAAAGAAGVPSRGCATAGLLAVLPGLTQLTHLGLQECLRGQQTQQGQAQHGGSCPVAQLYSALTAGAAASLVHLDLSFCRLPTAAWPAVFGRALPCLRVLLLSQKRRGGGSSSSSLSSRLDACGLSAVVAACPALQELHLDDALAPGVPLVALAPLSSCLTGLWLSGCAEPDPAAALLQLSSLAELHLASLVGLDDGQLMALTGLTHLTRLWASGTGLSSQVARLGALTLTLNRAPPGSPPYPLWLQLLQLCARSSQCQPLQQQQAAALQQAAAQLGAEFVPVQSADAEAAHLQHRLLGLELGLEPAPEQQQPEDGELRGAG